MTFTHGLSNINNCIIILILKNVWKVFICHVFCIPERESYSTPRVLWLSLPRWAVPYIHFHLSYSINIQVHLYSYIKKLKTKKKLCKTSIFNITIHNNLEFYTHTFQRYVIWNCKWGRKRPNKMFNHVENWTYQIQCSRQIMCSFSQIYIRCWITHNMFLFLKTNWYLLHFKPTKHDMTNIDNDVLKTSRRLGLRSWAHPRRRYWFFVCSSYTRRNLRNTRVCAHIS